MVRLRQKTLHAHVADANFQETRFTFAGHEISRNVAENQIKFPQFLAESDVSAEMARASSPRRYAKFAETKFH
jgi:hypothetical protein